MSESAVRDPARIETEADWREAPVLDSQPGGGRFRLAIPRDAIPFLILIAVGLVLRLWELGDRAQHHDESMISLFSYDLYLGRGFKHDPILHGTVRFIENALVYFLFGASDFTSRLAYVLHGTVIVGLPYLLRSRRYLGQAGAVAAAAFLCLSPSFLYYSRFAREDIIVASSHFAVAICALRYLYDQRARWLYALSALLAYSFAEKENTYITAAVFAAFLFVLCWRQVPGVLLRGGRGETKPATDLFVLFCTLVAPLGTAMLIVLERLHIRTNNDTLLGITLVLLFALSAVVGQRWNAGLWWTCALIFWGVFATLFTTIFTNPVGFWTGIIDSLRYWLAQQDVHRGEQPPQYYFVLLPLYEFLPIVLAAFGAWISVRERRLFGLFCLWWAVAALGFYTWAAEKMPWLSLHIALPLILLGSLALGRFVESVRWGELRERRAPLLAGVVLVALAMLLGITALNSQFPGGWSAAVAQVRGAALAPEAAPLTAYRFLLQWFGMALAFAALVTWGTHVASSLIWRPLAQTFAVLLLLIAGVFYVRAAFMVTYQFGDIPREMLIYTQTSPDVPAVVREIERLSLRSGQGTNFRVAYDSGVSWPFEWYLRNQRGRQYTGDSLPPNDIPVALVSFEPYGSTGMTREEAARQALGPNYVSTRFRLRWWFPEKYRDLRPADIPSLLRNEQSRTELWRFLLYREIEPLDSTDFTMFVRRDLLPDLSSPITPSAGAAPPAPSPVAAAPAAGPPLEQPTRVEAVGAVGAPGSGEGQLLDAKGVAIAPDGSVWVADTGNSRIVKFAPDGAYQQTLGGPGAGPGQFNEPWGVAVAPDGTLYVADTWNHRIQKFAPDGRFLAEWGSLGETRGLAAGGEGRFYGPRSIAFARDGSLLITDAGNKRVVRYDADGRFLGQFGGRGTEPGRFEEPIGIAADAAGNIYVADTWNRRIQKFDAAYQPIAQWPVSGWRTQDITNKPYIAVDGAGRVYITDPQTGRVQALSPEGQVLLTWGGVGGDSASLALPTGIALDAGNRVWVADSGNGRIMVFPPVPGTRG